MFRLHTALVFLRCKPNLVDRDVHVRWVEGLELLGDVTGKHCSTEMSNVFDFLHH